MHDIEEETIEPPAGLGGDNFAWCGGDGFVGRREEDGSILWAFADGRVVRTKDSECEVLCLPDKESR